MRGLHNIFRLVRMGATLARTGALKALFETFDIPIQIRLPIRCLCWSVFWLGEKGDKTLGPVPRALVALGPAYIKFGQILSTRPDIAGVALAGELRLLQDRLPPFSMAEAQSTIEKELGQPWQSCFSELSEPIAAASIAQVHKARLKKTGQEVAVKILRPGIEKAFFKNINAFHLAAVSFEAVSAEARRLRLCDIITHFENLVVRELDLRVEAAAASEFSSLTDSTERLRIPWVDFATSTRRMLVLEWMDGISLGDVAALKEAGHDPEEIGPRIMQMFLNHALRDGYFHGDMHQGNLMVGASGDVIALDFGIMGRIDDYTRRVYAEILHGFITRDYRRVAEIHFEAGYVPPNQDVDAFAQALRAVGEPIFGIDAVHLSMAHLLSHLFEVTERFGMKTRTELILLQRTMVVVEGVARSLSPKLNIWEVSRPIVEKYVIESIGPRAVLDDLMRAGRVLVRFGPHLQEIAQTMFKRYNTSPSASEKKPKKMGYLLLFGGGIILGAALALVLSNF